ncbi:hypothetical protein M409DRAFT_57458 [Zasmidium cellare ATCC 36951]|uniref:Apple domain-containing protein n=1 Tax=Zasmidium cellare ATCC 36951 TaxID=1080233 RepID=A0A6A6C972_ZASCE|nr:uncharacterized protein M409DRAFT_57458 [Zasmidium cellare ATCC 36951]KAF2163575.1 hypothetical protein M409DRAFT_57458 [Zasmidium cellare ATCC 36951]
MSLPKSVLVSLLAAFVADAAPQIGVPKPPVDPLVKTIFTNLPSSLPTDVKTSSAIIDGATRAIIIPATLPTTTPQVVQDASKTAANVVQTVTAFLADPVPSKTVNLSASASIATTASVSPPPIINNASVPVLSGTQTVGVTSIGDQATKVIESLIATASPPGPGAVVHDAALSTCGILGAEYNDGDQITSGDNTYTVHCSQDNGQGAFAIQFVAWGGFNACPAACDNTPGCTGFTFVGEETGFCYLKSAEGTSASSRAPSSSPTSSASGTPSSSTSSAPSSSPTSSTGQSCSQLGKTYVDSKNQTYTIACKTDLPGNDIGAVQASSFTECFDACAKKDGCVAFSFLGGSGSDPCYLKNSAVASASNPNNADSAYLPSARPSQTSQAGQSPSSSGSSSAAPTAIAAGSCEALAKGSGPSQFTDEFGSLYKITCKHDIPGGNLKAVTSPTFQDCFAQCDQTLNCVGFSWLNGYCYLKTFQQNSISESPADVAVKVRAGPGVPGTVTGGVGNSCATITMPQISATSVVPTPLVSAGASCKQLPPQVGLYKVTCGYDANGGDLSLAQANSFSACVPLCDTMPKCIGFACVGGSGAGICYFKQEHKPEGANSAVDIAFKPSVDATSAIATPTGLVTSVITAVPSVSTTILNGGGGIPFTNAPSSSKASTSSSSASSPASSSTSTSTSTKSSSTTAAQTRAPSTATIEPTRPVVPIWPIIVDPDAKPEPTTTKKKAEKPKETPKPKKPVPSTTTGDGVFEPSMTPKAPLLNPGWPIPDQNDWGSSCDELLEKNPFKLVTEVIRGRQSLGEFYVQTPLGENSAAPNNPGHGAKTAVVGRNVVHAASFAWARGDTLAMINNVDSVTRCYHPGFSLMPPKVGFGEVSFIPQWGSEGASLSRHTGISFDLHGAHEFGGWRVCEGDQQLKWIVAGESLDEGRCAEVMLKPEGMCEGENWVEG